MRKILYSLIFCSLLSTSAFAQDVAKNEIVKKEIADAKKVGEARLEFLFWDVYDATLYAPKGKLEGSKEFALSINYLLDFNGVDIAARSIEEIRNQGFSDEVKLADWHEKMKDLFPNIKEGDNLTATFINSKQTDFYHNNKFIGSIKDSEFTTYFADIWLSEKTSEPELRKKLLGLL